MAFHEITDTFFKLMSQMLPSMFIGIFLANILSRSGKLNNIGFLMSPLSNGANLPQQCSSALTLCFLNKEASFAMLSQLYHKNSLSKKEVIVVSMLAHLPLSIRSIIFFVAPISVSLLGLSIGLKFALFYLCLDLFKTSLGIITGRVLLEQIKSSPKIIEIKDNPFFSGWIDLLIKSFKESIFTIVRILSKVIPTLLITLYLLNSGALTSLSEIAEPLTLLFNLPSSSCIVIISGLPSMIMGIASAEPLISGQVITTMEALQSLIITSILHSLYNIIRLSLPVNISLFGPILGAQITIIAAIMEILLFSALIFLSTI
jgi:hypothetical protein